MSRVCVIGLDCLAPQLVFDQYRCSLPSFDRLLQESRFGLLESCVPPITVPAWACMVTGVDPGSLGVYGFRVRPDRSYERRTLASSLSFAQPPVWTLLSRAGLRCKVAGVPLTFPPKPLRGRMVSGCLTPDSRQQFTYPKELASELLREQGSWLFDSAAHRTSDKQKLLEEIYALTAQQFDLAEAWAQEDDWDFLMMVDMGADRMHHGFWRHAMPDHPGHEPGHALAGALPAYYQELDRRVGRLLARLRSDDLLLVVSDHGAQSMLGGIAINQWLLNHGYLALRDPPATPAPLTPNNVDWTRTRAWADGGHVARLYLNIAGRDPCGVVQPADSHGLLEELQRGLLEIRGLDGEQLATVAYRPETIYREVRGVAPDLIIGFGGYSYRALASIGHGKLQIRENDTGPDDANHSRHGVVILRDGVRTGKLNDATLYDIAPTVLHHLGRPVPNWMIGKRL